MTESIFTHDDVFLQHVYVEFLLEGLNRIKKTFVLFIYRLNKFISKFMHLAS